MKQSQTSHSDIVKLIAANVEHLETNLRHFWSAWVFDLIKGGVDRDAVVNTLYDCAVVMQLGQNGMAKTNELLRQTADYHEQHDELPEDSRTKH